MTMTSNGRRPPTPPVRIRPGSPAGPRTATPTTGPGPEAGTVAGPVADGTPTDALVASYGMTSLVRVAFYLGALVSIFPWLHGTTPLRNLADQLTAAGRITGLLGTYLVLAGIVLMGRLPWLENGVGADRLSRWHASNGRYAVGLLVAHMSLITVGYAMSTHTAVTTQTWALLTAYPDVLMAYAGLGLFVAVGVVSARAARRRMRYETWYYLHLYVYLALALSFAHQLANGQEFVSDARNRVLWSLLYVGTLGLVGWYRVAVPLLSNRRHRLRVARVVREADGVASVYVTGRELDALGARSGQFFRWRFLTRDGWWQSHPYSLSAAPNGSWLRITVKALGDHSRVTGSLTPGTRVFAEGPYGAFTASRRTRRRVLLVGGGVGVTPLRALLEDLPGRPGDITLMYRAIKPSDVVFEQELAALAERRGCRVLYAMGQHGAPGVPDPFSPASLRAAVADLTEHDVYVCGPGPMAEAVERGLRAAGVPRSQIHTEAFAL